MELQVQLRNNIFIGICLLMLGFVACRTDRKELVTVNASEHTYYTRAGITYVDSIPFTGQVYGLYDNKDTAFSYSYKNGKQDGRCTEWYMNKQVKETRWYKDNRKDGEHKGWFENGKPKFIAHYRNDIYEGNVKEWLESGLLFKDFNYKNGQEEGMQRMYWSDGKIRANYQCINGRNYGLTGVKNCVSVWADSIGH